MKFEARGIGAARLNRFLRLAGIRRCLRAKHRRARVFGAINTVGRGDGLSATVGCHFIAQHSVLIRSADPNKTPFRAYETLLLCLKADEERRC
jgi:hypothetical protein